MVVAVVEIQLLEQQTLQEMKDASRVEEIREVAVAEHQMGVGV